jgi:hypothetical protein
MDRVGELRHERDFALTPRFSQPAKTRLIVRSLFGYVSKCTSTYGGYMNIHKSMTQKAIDANQKNSHHGHGPTTTRGKEIVRYNAVKHGLLARALVFKTEREEESFRAYRKRLCKDIAPQDALELMFVEDLANAEWRLKRATRWEQNVGMRDDTTAIAEDALQSGTQRLGILSFPGEENSRGWRCKELSFSLTKDKDSKPQNISSLSDDPGGVELTATLTDPVGDLDTILRYQRAIRRDRDNAIDRLLKLQRNRAKAERDCVRDGSER